MQRRILCALLAASAFTGGAAAAADVSKSCKYEASDCVSGSATARFVDGRLSAIDLDVFYCGLPGNAGYSCSIQTKRGDDDFEWTGSGQRVTLRNLTPFDSSRPDEILITVGKNVSIDLSNAQSAGACGAGAELPAAIVILEGSERCRVVDRR